MLGGGLGRLGGLDVLHQALLRLGLGLDDQRLPVAFRLLDGAQLLDLLLLLRDGLLHGDALADDVGDLPLLALDLLVLGDAPQLRLAVARDDFEHAVLLDALVLDGDDAVAVEAGDDDLAFAVLVVDAELLVGLDGRGLGAQPLLGLDAGGLGLLAGAGGLHLAPLLDLRVGLTAFEFENGLARVDVLARDLLLLGAPELVGEDVLRGRQLGDLADALRVEDVVGVQGAEGGLLQVVDGRVLQAVAVEVGADHRDDAVAELLALGVEVGEVELLADGLQRLGELGVEQLLEGRPVAGALGADGLRHLDDVGDGLVDADEERDPDVGPDVVPADQALLSGAADLDGLHGDVHDLGLVQHGHHQRAGERHVDLADLGDDERLALLDLAEQAREYEHDRDDDDQHHGDEHAEADANGVHGWLGPPS